jgi:hypothetical protein
MQLSLPNSTKTPKKEKNHNDGPGIFAKRPDSATSPLAPAAEEEAENHHEPEMSHRPLA